MTKCFLVPMTEPPYSRENNQRPKYMDELQINWSGSPLFKAKMFVLLANSTPEKLAQLQRQEGVVDFPNIDDDLMDNLPVARKTKDRKLKTLLKLSDQPSESVADFINRCAQKEGNKGWNKRNVFVPDGS